MGGRSGKAVIPTSLPSVPGPNTHTQTHTHTSLIGVILDSSLVAVEAWNHVVGESAESLLLRPKESQKIL